jgi:hypothetical protein
MICEKCSAAMADDEVFQHAGKQLCEDCYLDIMAMPKTCDPWAVHSAKNTPGQQVVLTPSQQQLLDLIRGKGPLTLEKICSELKIDETEFRRQFATLRHMELARGSKEGDRVVYRVYND